MTTQTASQPRLQSNFPTSAVSVTLSKKINPGLSITWRR
jgi:hypothetical protein